MNDKVLMNIRELMKPAALLVLALFVTACGQPDGQQEEAAAGHGGEPAAAEAAHGGDHAASSEVDGGSYNKDGVAPFGMTSKKPVEVPELAAEAPAEAAVAASLADENALFGVHCASCHGPDGKGVEPLGVTLVGSAFIQSKSQDELVAMLKVGRMPGDPDSVKQRVMPGFNWMTDEQLNEIAAFLKSKN